jgi:hypothetical protein
MQTATRQVYTCVLANAGQYIANGGQYIELTALYLYWAVAGILAILLEQSLNRASSTAICRSRGHTCSASAYVSIRQHTSAYVTVTGDVARQCAPACISFSAEAIVIEPQ